MSIPFPAGGRLYYTKDLEKLGGRTGISLDDERFCIGPDVRLYMWHGRRSQIDAYRGPYTSVDAALVAPARKELAYMEKFGRPLQPFWRERRESYGYKGQLPSDNIENLRRYIFIAPSLVPRNPAPSHFCIPHPDLHPSNVIVSKSPDSDQLKIVSLIDWQHATVLPMFLHAGIPNELQNYNDPVLHALIPPSLPANIHEMDENERGRTMNLHYSRLILFHYIKATEKYNKLHHDALSDPASMFISRLSNQAGQLWDGDPHDLQAVLMRASKESNVLSHPLGFDADEICKTEKRREELDIAEDYLERFRDMIDFYDEFWVLKERYAEAKALAKEIKLKLSTMMPDEQVKAGFETHWFSDDMDETDYM